MLDADRLVCIAAEAGWSAGAVGEPEVLKESPALVVWVPSNSGGRIVKAHRSGTDAVSLQQRLDLAAASPPFLPSVSREPVAVEGRLVTCWPAGEPVDPDRPDDAPWRQAAELLAAVHGTRPDRPLPPLRVERRIARMLRRLDGVDHPTLRTARAAVLAAADRLPEVGDGFKPSVCHGDFHLGQLVRCSGRWRLIDVDELGVGDARWDFAWLAAWFAVGVLPPQVWAVLVDTYRAAGGSALGTSGDPWPQVDAVARAGTVHVAARGLVSAAEGRHRLDEVDEAFIDACVRMVSTAVR